AMGSGFAGRARVGIAINGAVFLGDPAHGPGHSRRKGADQEIALVALDHFLRYAGSGSGVVAGVLVDPLDFSAQNAALSVEFGNGHAYSQFFAGPAFCVLAGRIGGDADRDGFVPEGRVCMVVFPRAEKSRSRAGSGDSQRSLTKLTSCPFLFVVRHGSLCEANCYFQVRWHLKPTTGSKCTILS